MPAIITLVPTIIKVIWEIYKIIRELNKKQVTTAECAKALRQARIASDTTQLKSLLEKLETSCEIPPHETEGKEL